MNGWQYFLVYRNKHDCAIETENENDFVQLDDLRPIWIQRIVMCLCVCVCYLSISINVALSKFAWYDWLRPHYHIDHHKNVLNIVILFLCHETAIFVLFCFFFSSFHSNSINGIAKKTYSHKTSRTVTVHLVQSVTPLYTHMRCSL